MLWDLVEFEMKKKGFTQYQLSKKMGVSSSVITELKKGNIKKPSFELMCKIGDALEVSLDVFRKE